MAAHKLVLGMTMSGKTMWAKTLSRKLKESGHNVIVYDPLGDPGWCADFQTSNEAEFLECIKNSRSCYVFIDESGETVGKHNQSMIWTATRGRHRGHRFIYIAQRATLIDTTVRDQCSELILFTSSARDGKIHADEWNRPELQNCHTLAQGDYFFCNRFGQLKRGNIFTEINA